MYRWRKRKGNGLCERQTEGRPGLGLGAGGGAAVEGRAGRRGGERLVLKKQAQRPRRRLVRPSRRRRRRRRRCRKSQPVRRRPLRPGDLLCAEPNYRAGTRRAVQTANAEKDLRVSMLANFTLRFPIFSPAAPPA